MAQAFLKQNESTNTAVSVLEGKDLLEPDMEIQDVIPFNFGLAFIACDQFSQTGMDFVSRQQLTIPGPGGWRPVLTGTNLLPILVHRTGHQDFALLRIRKTVS